MEIIKELRYIKDSCIGLGFFDGVHAGHAVLLDKLSQTAKNNNLNSVVLTFKKSPAEKFIKKVDYINSKEEREFYISTFGIDYMVELDFDDTLMNLSAGDYLNNIIFKYFQPKYIISGFNHSFGKNKKGNPEFLMNNQSQYNYNYIEIPPVEYKDEIISATNIRNSLIEGDIEKANNMLGRNFTIEGIVQHGNHIGRTIGFPTANIDYPEYKPKIPYGVYCAGVCVDGQYYKGMLNYGIKPTVTGKNSKPVAEVHIINFNDDIYGKTIKISVIKKIRDEKKFNSLDELKNQINEDLKKC